MNFGCGDANRNQRTDDRIDIYAWCNFYVHGVIAARSSADLLRICARSTFHQDLFCSSNQPREPLGRDLFLQAL